MISALRSWMTLRGLEAMIIPSSDPHGSEYTAAHWAVRARISGFTGSAGTFVLTHHKAALWTDSRYFLQAQAQLPQQIELQKISQAGVPTPEQWIADQIGHQAKVGIDGRLWSCDQFRDMSLVLPSLELTDDPFDEIWKDRPPLPEDPAFLLDLQYAGQSAASKIEKLCPDEGTLLVTALDDVAWLLNIRGRDIAYNPLVMSYAAVSRSGVKLFIKPGKLTPAQLAELTASGVETIDYDSWYDFLPTLTGQQVWINSARLDIRSLRALSGSIIKQDDNRITRAKAIKNEIEIAGFRRAMEADRVALTEFWEWLNTELDRGAEITEAQAGHKIAQCRARGEGYFGESFAPIVGYGANGAIVHYTAPEQGSAVISRDNFLLIDCGGQYLYGTTDITRTVFLGKNPTPAQRRDYNDVLTGLRELSSAVFPVGTRGSQLDVLARRAMWNHSTNYLHGTGHGVGHFLCVHEGPQSIRMNENPVVLEPGMILSIEPGIYRDGEYGIRLENLVLVCEHSPGFLCFETLTKFPIAEL